MTYNSTSPRPRHPLRRRIALQVALPPDIIDEEVTYILLFRLSVLLNRATGGHRDMTFSARTAQQSGRSGKAARYWWRPLHIVIDAYCRAARGEAGHCATALANFHRRR